MSFQTKGLIQIPNPSLQTKEESSAGVPPARVKFSMEAETPNTVAITRNFRRGLLVRTGATPANTMVPALTSKALLAKREAKATVFAGPPPYK
jgi:hypothetical protein